nr:hypothetical protein [Tanacetum cinerariifolium]
MMRYGLLRILWGRQSQLTPNILKAKPLHARTVRWSSWGDECHLRSRGNDNGVVFAHEVRSSVSSGDKVRRSFSSGRKVRSSVSLRGKKMSSVSSKGKEQCLLGSLRDEGAAAGPHKDRG